LSLSKKQKFAAILAAVNYIDRKKRQKMSGNKKSGGEIIIMSGNAKNSIHRN